MHALADMTTLGTQDSRVGHCEATLDSHFIPLNFASLSLVQLHLQARPIEAAAVAEAIKCGVCCRETPSGR